MDKTWGEKRRKKEKLGRKLPEEEREKNIYIERETKN